MLLACSCGPTQVAVTTLSATSRPTFTTIPSTLHKIRLHVDTSTEPGIRLRIASTSTRSAPVGRAAARTQSRLGRKRLLEACHRYRHPNRSVAVLVRRFLPGRWRDDVSVGSARTVGLHSRVRPARTDSRRTANGWEEPKIRLSVHTKVLEGSASLRRSSSRVKSPPPPPQGRSIEGTYRRPGWLLEEISEMHPQDLRLRSEDGAVGSS
ncbi:hypothetical protein V8E36_004385 [Tilletia maclaganii]